MIKINLLPVPKARKQEALIIQTVVGIAGLVFVAAACYFVGLQKKEAIVVAGQKNDQMRRQIEQLKAQVGEVEKFKKQVQTLEEQLGVIRALEKGRTGPVRMMEELTDLVPRKLWITSFKESRKSVQLDGMAESGMVIADFLDSLKGSRFFQNPVLMVVTSQDQSGQPVHRFQITVGVKYDI